MKKNSLSIALVCSNPISMDFPLKECLLSASQIADEVILINADSYDNVSRDGEVMEVLYSLPVWVKNIKVHFLPWSDNLRKNVYWFYRSVAIGLCEGDYIIRLDADEVLDTNETDKIRKCLELGYDSYTFRVKHFWRDYKHTISGENKNDPGNKWYERRIYLFKNGLGYYDRDYDIVDVDGNNLEPKHTSITVYHYGHVRDKDKYILKYNQINSRFHSDWKDINDWDWDMDGTSIFKGSHPEVMIGRISKHMKDNPEFYKGD